MFSAIRQKKQVHTVCHQHLQSAKNYQKISAYGISGKIQYCASISDLAFFDHEGLHLSSRSGTTQTSSMKPCRRRIRPTSRTWTLMTSLQLVTPAAPRQALASKPKQPTQATAKSTTACHLSTPPRIEPIKSSHMNGYVRTQAVFSVVQFYNQTSPFVLNLKH